MERLSRTTKAIPLFLFAAATAVAAPFGRPIFFTNKVTAWTPAVQFGPNNLLYWVDAHTGVTVDGSNNLVSWSDQGTDGLTVNPLSGHSPPVYEPTGSAGGAPDFNFSGSIAAETSGPFLPFSPGFGYSGPQSMGIVFEADDVIGPTNDSFGITMNGKEIGATITVASNPPNTTFFMTGVGGGSSPTVNLWTTPIINYANGTSLSTNAWNGPIWNIAGATTTVYTSSYSPTHGQALELSVYVQPGSGYPGMYESVTETTTYLPTNMWNGSSAGDYFYGQLGSAITQSRLMEHFISITDQVNPAATVAAITLHEFSRWGVNVPPVAACLGDSLTRGYQDPPTDSYPWQLQALFASAPIAVDCPNLGINSRTCSDLQTIDLPNYNIFVRPSTSLMVVWAGTNDIQGGATDAQTYTALQSLVTAIRAQGWTKVIVVDCIPRGSFTTQQEIYRENFNASLAAGWTSFADGFIQLTALSQFSYPTAYTNTTYYIGDGTHLTHLGYGVVASAAFPVVRQVLGL